MSIFDPSIHRVFMASYIIINKLLGCGTERERLSSSQWNCTQPRVLLNDVKTLGFISSYWVTTWLSSRPIKQQDKMTLKCNFPCCLLPFAGSRTGPWCWLCHIKPTSHLCWQARQRARCCLSLGQHVLSVGMLGKLEPVIAALLDHASTQYSTNKI